MDGMMEGGGWFGNGMDDLKRRLTALPEELSVKSTLAKAIRYTIGHWDGLTMFLTDGRVEVDSNTVERTMRTIAQGRHSYLFAGSERGARNWAILASLLTTARLNGVDPLTWLTDVLERIVSGRTFGTAVRPWSPVRNSWEIRGCRDTESPSFVLAARPPLRGPCCVWGLVFSR